MDSDGLPAVGASDQCIHPDRKSSREGVRWMRQRSHRAATWRTEMQPAFNELDKKSLAYLLSLALIIATVPRGVSQAQEQQGAPAPTSSSGYSGQGAPQTPEELQNLVAPIALYPDALLAQILR